MPNSDNETFDLDDRHAEIVPALRKSGKGNFMKLIVNSWWLNWNRQRLVCETVSSKYLVTTFLYILLIVFAQLNIKIIKLLVK